MAERLNPLEDMVGDLFVNRQEELEQYWEWAMNVPSPANSSQALVGRRRAGKTAILVKLFNRLYHEQQRVLPVFISFARYLHSDRPLTMEEVGDRYLSSYVSSYLAFRYHQPTLLWREPNMARIQEIAPEFNDALVNELIKDYNASLESHLSEAVAQFAINVPRIYARLREMPTVVIVDEFQALTTVYDPKQNVSHDLTDSFQWAVDTKWAPMLVSGSAVSLLVGRALGGLLSGRFQYTYLSPLPHAYAHELVFRMAEQTHVTANDELAEAIWALTGGYPYTIQGIMSSRCPARRQLPSLDALEETVTFELTNRQGELWQHYTEEFEKFSHQLNTGKTTRRVMLWAVKHPAERIDAERVSQELGIAEEDVKVALEKLRWVDIIEKIGLISYQGPNDPMLRRFIEYQHYTEIEKLGPEKAIQDWETEYRQIRGKLNRALGEIGELYVRMIMRGFDGQVIDGAAYFNCPAQMKLPKFAIIEQQGGVVVAGQMVEIDVIAEWSMPDSQDHGSGVWLVEAKYTQEPMGEKEVTHFLTQANRLLESRSYGAVTRWFFSKAGFTEGAEQILQGAGVLYNDWAKFHALARQLGFFGLPTGKK